MKNLKLWNFTVRDIVVNPEEEVCMCFGNHDEYDKRPDSLIYVGYPNLTVNCFAGNTSDSWCKDLKDLVSPDNKVVDVTYLPHIDIVSVVYGNGELVTIGANGKEVGQHRDTFDEGLKTIAWAPDHEVVAVVTKTNKLILITCYITIIAEAELDDTKFGEQEFVTVGWGKKETQFHGRAGKGARALTEVTPETNDDTVVISWRGDGKLFAVGLTIDGIRRFKIFDRDGHLQFTSEKQPGLGTQLAWRPSGNVIATTQKVDNKYMLSFFEKNGLKHGGFELPINLNMIVEDLSWSSDSEIIAIQCKDTHNVQQVLLFTSSNYHWYLKQTLVFDGDDKIRKIFWSQVSDVAHNKELNVVLDSGKICVYTWIWNIDHSTGMNDEDDAVVAVIDGKKILVTGFRQTVVPPPMCAVELVLDSNVNFVCFTSTDKTNAFFAVTCDHKLVVFEQTQKFPLQYKQTAHSLIEKPCFPLQYYHWHWLAPETVLCVKNLGCTIGGNISHHIVEYNFDSNKFIMTVSEKLPSSVLNIRSDRVSKTMVHLLLQSGEVLEYKSGGTGSIIRHAMDKACPKFDIFYVCENIHYIGLTEKGNLLLDNSVIMRSVSSYFIHTHFLLLTTLEHELLCVELTKSAIQGLLEGKKDVSDNIYKRKIERGAKLVIAVPNDTRTVFQMPRGNLEAIQPRPLSLKIIGKYLDSLKYFEAFDLMRKQRINLNLIHDHNPKKFIENINVFLETIANDSWLSLFLSDLENVDITKTMYSSSYSNNPSLPQQDLNSKVRNICELVRSNLSLRSDTANRILPFLTSYVKTNTVEDLESALSLIKDLKNRESSESKLPVGSDEALKYLLYMVDVNTLFDVSLGMYDLDLVLLVTNKSQKDPKEFIPMLNELNDMEENYRKFSINKHLKKFDKAVKCLVDCGAEKHGELKTFVKYHSLYKDALQLFSPAEEIYKEISEDFGVYLKLEKQFAEAGIVFERGNHIENAIECYKDALEWELAVNLAQEWPKKRFEELCLYLVEGLKQAKRHSEALSLLEQYWEDKDHVIRYAVEAGSYKTAIRLCSRYNKHHLIDEILKPAVVENYNDLLEQVQNNYSTFIRHIHRLQLVREAKMQHPLDVYDPTFAHVDSDLYSDAGSTVASSRGSSGNRSYRSSKNRRKHERKVASLKEGSPFEDVALVMAVHTLVGSSNELRLQTKEVVTALVWAGYTKEAGLLQASLDKLLREMKESFRDIWTNDLMLEAAKASIAAHNAPEGTAVVPQGIASLDEHMRIAPVIQDINWKLDSLF